MSANTYLWVVGERPKFPRTNYVVYKEQIFEMSKYTKHQTIMFVRTRISFFVVWQKHLMSYKIYLHEIFHYNSVKSLYLY